MDARTRILEAAAELLSKAPDADVSTRAVCEAAGVGAPMLYRQFGDKEGLLSAVVDYGFEHYLAAKRMPRQSADPVQDLRDGWDNHVRFAVENPNYYRLMYSPGLSVPPKAAAEAHSLLLAVLERCAQAGCLRVSPETAAQMTMAANAGVALSLVTRPALYQDPALSGRVRDAVVAAITVPEQAVAPAEQRHAVTSIAVSAGTLAAQLRAAPPAGMTEPEAALLQQWLAGLANAPGTG